MTHNDNQEFYITIAKTELQLARSQILNRACNLMAEEIKTQLMPSVIEKISNESDLSREIMERVVEKISDEMKYAIINSFEEIAQRVTPNQLAE